LGIGSSARIGNIVSCKKFHDRMSMPVEQNGPVTVGTQRNLVQGLRSSPMRQTAVDAVMRQAAAFTEQLIGTYSAEIACGEVGPEGTGSATEEPILGERPPRALLYGRVQSGKTVAMILTSALCLDNGFRVVVVLTTDNVALVRQTAARFKSLDGPRVFSGAKEGSSYEWEGQEEQLREIVASDGLVLVCAKNSFNLPQVIRFLQQLDAWTYPVLVLDDEADAATPDTTLAARSAAKPNAPAFASTINRLVIENDRPGTAHEGFSLGEVLPHSLYVQVTATPYVLLLQRTDAQMRPTTTFLLEPGEGYCGGEVFFGNLNPNPAANQQPNTIVTVADNEAALMRRQVPAGLAKSIAFFILSACARATATEQWPAEGFKHLSHTSHKINDHDVVSAHIVTHLNEVRRQLRADNAETRAFFAEAYAELGRALQTCPALDVLLADASSALRQVEVVRVNSKADVPTYGPRLNFVVGGNILGRGLTIDDLLVTYYIREAKTSQMDTVWQHARMYGYRRAYLDYTRIYLPHRLGMRFKQIHEAEESLREALRAGDDAAAVLIQVPRSARPTRTNALEAGVVRTIEAGRDQVFPHFLRVDAASASMVLQILADNQVPVGVTDRDARSTPVPLDAALSLISTVAVDDEDPGLWQPETIAALMRSFEQQLQGRCIVYVREVTGTPPNDGWWRGRLGGPEIAMIRQASVGAPALALLYNGDMNAPTAWYPTLVMPSGTPTYVFSE
jgi:hypothetical protein